jgi:hypothetical protein
VGLRGNQRATAFSVHDLEEDMVLRAIADVLRAIGGTLAAVVTLPFRALARLLGGASRSAR